ncbi:MAG: hypothetical protein QOF96_617 [Actinomycetota bacterium]|nr:hypothetical protein [Actinomycetota bacterium]
MWGAAVFYYGLHAVRIAVLADHEGLETLRTFPYGTLFTQSKEQGREKSTAVAAEWRRRMNA